MPSVERVAKLILSRVTGCHCPSDTPLPNDLQSTSRVRMLTERDGLG